MCRASCITQNYSMFEAKHKSWAWCDWETNLIGKAISTFFLKAWFHLSDVWKCYLIIQPANLTCISRSYPLNYHWILPLYSSKLSVQLRAVTLIVKKCLSHSLPTCNLASQKSPVSHIKLKLWAAGSCVYVCRYARWWMPI